MIGQVDEVIVDCSAPAQLAKFWSGVLGGRPVERSAEWAFVDPPGWTRLAFQRVPEFKRTKNRLHIDVSVDDVVAATEAAERLGAARVGNVQEDPAGTFQVLLDPEGNEWCVVRSIGG
ncbi:VOC family protein [Rhodococcus erythropolis]|uniref:VOC family protein n=1 Tax=Rhodococcus erythropolis TaxID=1833 RepID=UPI0029494219|nr:VOC family protein [Rhodococcus erythropolis]MDV6274374.1 VOC family protein [Rhodococcus erythropolis]